MPLSIFDTFIRETIRKGNELHTNDLLNLSERHSAKARNRLPMPGGQIDDLDAHVHAGIKFGTLYCDPPWAVPGAVLP